jgi:MscS family membrane protein
MNDLARQFGFSFLAEPWLTEILVVTVAVVALNLAAYYLLRQIEKAASRTASVWDDALIRAARQPLTLILWVAGLTYAFHILERYDAAPKVDAVDSIRDTLVIIGLAWFLFRLISNVSHNILERNALSGESLDRTTIDALSKLGRFSILIVAALIILQNLGFSISGVLAFGGIGGIAVGFAAKDMLANFFGGLTIYLDRPFVVGEWIRSPDKDIEGTVEYIGWRHTRVRAFNKNPIYVPNALFTTIVVENPSRMTNRRIRETIGVRYSDLAKLPGIVADVKAMLEGHLEIDSGTTLIVNFNQFAESSLDIMIYCFTRTTAWVHYHEVKQDVLLKIADIIGRHGAEIAFPTRTLHVEAGEPPAATNGPA